MNKKLLQDIGLTGYESEMYLTLLQHGQLSAYALAEKTGLYRQVTYDALNRLIEKGFVSSVKEGKARMFKAIDPSLILEYLNDKTERYQQQLPELQSLYQQSASPMIVETYRGKNITRIALRDIINALKAKGGEVLCTAVDETIPFAKYKTLCEQYERDMLRFKIKESILIQVGSRGIFKKGTSQYRTLPKKFFNPNPVQVYGNNVQITAWGNPDYLIIIRSKAVAEAYRKQFHFMWTHAKPLS